MAGMESGFLATPVRKDGKSRSLSAVRKKRDRVRDDKKRNPAPRFATTFCSRLPQARDWVRDQRTCHLQMAFAIVEWQYESEVECG